MLRGLAALIACKLISVSFFRCGMDITLVELFPGEINTLDRNNLVAVETQPNKISVYLQQPSNQHGNRQISRRDKIYGGLSYCFP